MTLARTTHWTPYGRFSLDYMTFRQIPNDPGLVSAMEEAIHGTAARASALANERYTVSTCRGVFRTYVEAAGQPPHTKGYWRGKKVRALWSSRPRLTNTGSR